MPTSRPDTDCNLKDSPRFAHLPADVIAALNEIGHVRSYPAGRTVLFENDESRLVGTVKSGVLRVIRRVSTGQEHIVGLLQEGDMFGRGIDPADGCVVEAATDAKICTFRRAEFDATLRRSRELQRLVQASALDGLATVRDWLVIVSNHRMKARLAGFLLLLRARREVGGRASPADPAGRDIRIPISRLDLSNLLGTRQESISRAFHALADDGTIRILEPNLIRILDLDGLADMAGGDVLAATARVTGTGRRRRDGS